MTMQSRDRVVRVLHVEDDQFQQMTFSAVASSIGQGDSGLRVQVTTVETANAALEALEDGTTVHDVLVVGADDAPVMALKGLRLKAMANVPDDQRFSLER